MLKRLIAALVLTSAVALAPVAASAAEDKMEHKEMNMEKNHMKREHRHHMMRHHGLMNPSASPSHDARHALSLLRRGTGASNHDQHG